MNTAPSHLRELSLRQLFASEEVLAVERQHLEQCGECRARLENLREEQRQFEAEFSFERFAGGVDRAVREQKRPRSSPNTWLRWSVALAASLVLVVIGARGGLFETSDGGPNRIKSGAEVEVVVRGVGAGLQRTVAAGLAAPEPLAEGEQVRIGYRTGDFRYVAALSIDAYGAVTMIYPEAGQSALAKGGDALVYLPDSLEFTGHGLERVFVVLSSEPLPLDVLSRAAQEAYRAAGNDLSRLSLLAVPGEQFQRTFLKP
ncbi:MAG: DUF4384 domain-containing protein [Myxococcaceae bacterium]|nr:DUF4384 domain-containing protein [Myxococcaceae bacterium]